MENPKRNFRQSSIVFDKPSILSEKLKTLTSSNYHRIEYFSLKFCTCFLLTNVYIWCLRFFLFCLDFELFANIRKDLVYTHLQKPVFTFLLIAEALNKTKKSSKTLL